LQKISFNEKDMRLMKRVGTKPIVTLSFLVVAATGIVWAVFSHLQERGGNRGQGEGASRAPVEVAQIQQAPIEWRRTFSGALEARAEFIVAPKVSGRVQGLNVNLADTVTQGQVVAELDNDEYVQAVAQAKADVEVARANIAEANSALEIANRELQRVITLRSSGVASESQYDAAQADQLAKQAQLEVAKAQLARANAALETANIRMGYTKVTADWTDGDEDRVVAERYVDEGDTVSANAPLLLIVELDPITGVIFVTEKDYAFLRPGQPVSLNTDAYPGEVFEGRIERIAPIFQHATRQARVELIVRNEDHRLKPGLFVRATVVLDRVEEATIVPQQALTKRADRTGVFVVQEDGQIVVWREVTVGLREGDRVQVFGQGLTGRVVTLGQHLLDDGSFVTIPADDRDTSGSVNRAAHEIET
jgi:RND family efflux transporter MFP subunit